MNKTKLKFFSRKSTLATKNHRQHAKTKLETSITNVTPENLSSEEVLHLVHELQTQQIELEMQNEELHKVQTKLQQSHAQYFNLYEHAPVGYLTLDTRSLIKANFENGMLTLIIPKTEKNKRKKIEIK